MLPRLLTTDEVCEHLGISVATLRKMHKRGAAPPHITLGNAIRRYPEDQLAAWVAARSDTAPPDPPEAANEETPEEATGTAS